MVVRVVVLVVASLTLWGCGSDSDTDVAVVPSVSSDPPASTPDSADPEPAPVEITIADFAFVGDQQALAGATVVVTNTDAASHTWTAVDGAFDSGTLAEGESFEFTFDQPGTFEYRCDIHPSMTGSIDVT